MSKRFPLVLAILIFSTLILLSYQLQNAYADDIDDLRQQQEEIKQEMESTKKDLEEKQKEEQSLAEIVKEIAQKVELVQNELEEIESRLASTEQQLEQAESELEKINAELLQKIETFKKRLVDIYKNRDVETVEVLLDSDSFTDFLVRVEMFKKIAEHDLEMLDEIKEKKKEQELKKEELEKRRNEVAALQKETAAKKKELEEQQNEQQKFLEAVQNEKELIEKSLKEKEETHTKITNMIKKLQLEQEGLSSRAPTEFAWPTPGYTRITSEYGWRIHPILKTKRWHSGIDIAAPMGSKVVAAEDGKVVFTGWYGAYGNTIIVMHGGGISTMYPHLSKILVEEGQIVARGEKVGEVGSTGLSTGPHIHFEVMKDGKDINPWSFFK